MKPIYQLVLLLTVTVLLATLCTKNTSSQYSGTPFSDSLYTTGAQIIPGKLQCEYYDLGGEGIAYHDSDSTNSGSGGLNPADGSYLHEFRINEDVDISYTKIDEREIDNNPFNSVDPQKDQLYVGWTEPGEWMKYTVHVQKTGLYTVGLMYTSNRGGQISLSVDDQDLTGPIIIPTTFVKEDPLDWRQWHHWNYQENIAEIELIKGIHVLTLSTVAEGSMNYDFLEFSLKK
ncbi:carbohydrate-binding protein [candidate division KSB1 bacterium]|nr:carbohydrate-binding protein [candidate division KSB1 bacterium]